MAKFPFAMFFLVISKQLLDAAFYIPIYSISDNILRHSAYKILPLEFYFDNHKTCTFDLTNLKGKLDLQNWIPIIRDNNCELNILVEHFGKHNASGIIIAKRTQKVFVKSKIPIYSIHPDDYKNLIEKLYQNIIKNSYHHKAKKEYKLEEASSKISLQYKNLHFHMLHKLMHIIFTSPYNLIFVFFVIIFFILIFFKGSPKVYRHYFQQLNYEELKLIYGDDISVITCSICFDHFMEEDDFCKLKCSHIFHKECLVPWLDRTRHCPMCRIHIDGSYEAKD